MENVHINISKGSDFDGTGSVANGLEDVSSYPRLIEAVMRRGATDEQIKRLVGENILRVWRENEKVAAEIQNGVDSQPVESFWEGRAQPSFEGSLPSLKGFQ